MPDFSPGPLLREARTRAGLTQRALARRARTAQSVVARIEAGTTSPSWNTLVRLLAASGFDLDGRLEVRPVRKSHMLADVARILRLSPEERLLELRNVSQFVSAARRV
ncbi:MAG: helix-turn-helix domain-containing protein [Gemmatimonadales bacterium]